MVKATLEFNLPEESNEHRMAIDGNKWHLVLWDVDQQLRSIVKYGEDEKKAEFAEEFRNKIIEMMNDNGLVWPD